MTNPGQGPDEDPGKIQVTDRRRFTETGEERPEARDVVPPAAGAAKAAGTKERPAPAPPPPSHGSRAMAAEARGGQRDASTLPPPEAEELGIQAVFLIFWQSAMLALGASDPTGRRMEVDLGEARQAIGLLRVLQHATRGNLTPEESGMLEELLHDVQMKYVQAAKSGGLA